MSTRRLPSPKLICYLRAVTNNFDKTALSNLDVILTDITAEDAIVPVDMPFESHPTLSGDSV